MRKHFYQDCPHLASAELLRVFITTGLWYIKVKLSEHKMHLQSLLKMSDDEPEYTGLTDQHKEHLSALFPEYIAASSHSERRAIADRGVASLGRKFNITDKDERQALTTVCLIAYLHFLWQLGNDILQSVRNFMYDRLYRGGNSRPERYAFMKSVNGRFLWARSEHTSLQPLILKHKQDENVHYLTAYHAITGPAFAALPDLERKKWKALAAEMNEGNGPDELKAECVVPNLSFDPFHTHFCKIRRSCLLRIC